MKKLRDVALRPVPVVEPSASLADVLVLLREEPLQIVVLVGDEQYMGVFTPQDADAELIPPGADLADLQVGPYATSLRFVGSPQMSVEEARNLMTRRGFTVLPVVDNRTFRGVVTRADLEA